MQIETHIYVQIAVAGSLHTMSAETYNAVDFATDILGKGGCITVTGGAARSAGVIVPVSEIQNISIHTFKSYPRLVSWLQVALDCSRNKDTFTAPGDEANSIIVEVNKLTPKIAFSWNKKRFEKNIGTQKSVV